jgi:cytidine deaminase
MTPKMLIAEAERALENAYAPYSRFKVGAALLTRSGRVYPGCNVENASFGLAICAERNAVFRAVCDGERDFVAVAIVDAQGHGASPCGACRQVMHEFAPGLLVYWRDARGRIVRKRLSQLLGSPFDLVAPARKKARTTSKKKGAVR